MGQYGCRAAVYSTNQIGNGLFFVLIRLLTDIRLGLDSLCLIII